MSGRYPTRADYDLALWMLRQRCAGASSGQIGKALGRTSASVRVATDRIRKADAAESGEDVTQAYWETDTWRT